MFSYLNALVHRFPRFVSQLAVGIVVVSSCAAAPVLAGTPQAVTIVTHLTCYPDTTVGTFAATRPICPTGTVSLGDEHFAEEPANVNGRQLFVCDDNSGTFVIRLHPQANGRPKDGFMFNGPWAISGRTGTGAYATLS